MQKANSGYTLLEILVVLVIISIVASMAMLTVGHNQNKELEAFTKELTQTLTLAEEQALLQPATLGLIFSTQSFRFYEYTQAKNQASWVALNDNELGVHPIPKGIEVTLQMGDKRILPETNLLSPQPSLLLSPNGSLTAFTILIGKVGETPRYQITGMTDGTVMNQVYRG